METWKNIKKPCKSNTLKISASTRNEDFELPDGSNSVLDIHDYLIISSKSIRLLLIILE